MADQRESIEFIAEATSHLKTVAAQAGHEFLAYLLSMAEEEAHQQAMLAPPAPDPDRPQ